ncbi:hypothetical protein ACMFKE_07920 [Staphylococcus haemolyticus]|uniref:hypothetical protein n=1 Tax=Staphylococcus borealis TaxID=2742203 RepID=UPI001F5464E8|nr:hypothetical protein [Staphylococcus borealis]
MKYISGLSLIVSILTFIMNMYYNSKAEEHKRLTNMPLFLFDMTKYGYEQDKDFIKDSIQIDIFNFEEDYPMIVNDKAKSKFIGKNKNYFSLKNVGGVAKNVVVKSEVKWNKEEFKNHEERIIYEDYERELTFDGEFCYLVSNNDKYGISNKRIRFNTHTTQSKIKGVSKDKNLLVSVPKELSYAINFYLFGYIKTPPKLIVMITGEDLAGNGFTDEIEINVQRYKFSSSPVKAEITMFA